jgi:hypothetical protein
LLRGRVGVKMADCSLAKEVGSTLAQRGRWPVVGNLYPGDKRGSAHRRTDTMHRIVEYFWVFAAREI